MQLQGPGIEHLVQLLLQDGPFSKAVQQQDTNAAASAAVGVVKSHLKAFSAALRPPGSISTGGHAAAGGGDSDSPVFRRIASEQQRRSSDTGAGTFRPDIRLKDRVVINTNQKKYDGNLVGKEGTVLQITSNGWVKLQVGNETLDIQMRYLTLVHPRGGTSSLVTSQSLPVGPAGTKVLGLDGKAGAVKGSRGIPRKSEVVKQVRKELTQLEEQVPWKEVQDRWRTHRKTWTRRLRQADTTRDMAICIREFHDHLKTDKATGLFAVGGSWELMLRECITGSGNHLQLLQVWEDMRSALQAWLAEGELPGGLASLDKSSYEQAVCTYQVLQEAASRGPEYLEQVPLDQILTSQKQLLALQHIIQREASAAHNRLQAMATGSSDAAAAAAQLSEQLIVPELEDGLTESMLLQLGKLLRLKSVEGQCSEVDTDKDAGSEATELEGSDMDTL